MARMVRIPGLLSMVIVDKAEEIEDLLEHPALERSLEVKGPLINRLLLRLARRQLITAEGKTIRSMREEDDDLRRQGQAALFKDLDGLARSRPWAPDAIALIAEYVETGDHRERALAALAYCLAFPFPSETAGAHATFDEAHYRKLYRRYRRLALARSPLSIRGFFLRLFENDRINRHALLRYFKGNDYGLHAVMVTMENAILILDKLRKRQEGETNRFAAKRPALRWLTVRTAPRRVLRQVSEDYSIPHVDERLAAGTLVMLNMRDALREDVSSCFEFAKAHWSACPAERYIMALFETIAEAAAQRPVAQRILENSRKRRKAATAKREVAA